MTTDRRARVRLFERVRAVPYATDGAHAAAELVTVGRGDCLAKSAYLVDGFRAPGCPARRVRWLYHLPDQPRRSGFSGPARTSSPRPRS
ncbi:hypothetical protein [Streptomyces albipurpureus]|uniref:Transglutaminase-like domain-containing protein n=1 Tax=Streptomyces albipurpureus TaxID=2897419 RepID=A0ABT0UQ64_9ACTN|nr:hypothetical protein [Streptomyces sp. CWNU-1]MCM2390748.1 hypothetical protein [Streptomyces sp. CWNU-1]